MATQFVRIKFEVDDKDLKDVKRIMGQVGKQTDMTEKEVKQLDRALDRAGNAGVTAGKKVSKGMRGIGAAAKSLGPVLGGLFAVAKIVEFGKESTRLADIQLTAEAKIRQSLVATSGAAGKTFAELTKMASDLQANSLFGDEEILEKSTATLLTFTKISGDTFDRASQNVIDYAAFMKKDLQGAAVQVGKALNDPIKGVTALSLAGVQFTDAQRDTIKAMVNTNNVAGAQAIILKELEVQFGGAAKAAAAAGLGPFDQFLMVVGDIQEEVGKKLIPVINGLAGWFVQLFASTGPIVDLYGKLGDNISSVVSSSVKLLEMMGLINDESSTTAKVIAGLTKVQEVMLLPLTESVKVIRWITNTGFPLMLGGWAAIIGAAEVAGSAIVGTFQAIGAALHGDLTGANAILGQSFDNLGGRISTSMDEAFRSVFDRFRVGTKETTKEVDKLGVSGKKAADGIGDGPKGLGGAAKLTAGSLAALKKEVSDMAKVLDNAVVGSVAWEDAILNLEIASDKLKLAQEQLRLELLQFESSLTAVNDIDTIKVDSLIDPKDASSIGQRAGTDFAEGFNESTKDTGTGDLLSDSQKEKLDEVNNRLNQVGEVASSLNAVFDQVFQNQLIGLENRTQKEIDLINNREKAELAARNLTEEGKERIQAKFDAIRAKALKKSDDEKKKFQIANAKREKAFAITQSIIQTALAISNAVAQAGNPILAAVFASIIGTLATVQQIAIATTPIPQFKTGGTVQTGTAQGPSHQQGGILGVNRAGALFEFEGGEEIFSRKKTKEFAPLFKKIQTGQLSAETLNRVAIGGASPVINLNQSEVVKAINTQKITVNRFDEFGFSEAQRSLNSNTEIKNRKYSF